MAGRNAGNDWLGVYASTVLMSMGLLAGATVLWNLISGLPHGNYESAFQRLGRMDFWVRAFHEAVSLMLIAHLVYKARLDSFLWSFGLGLAAWFLLSGESFLMGVFRGYFGHMGRHLIQLLIFILVGRFALGRLVGAHGGARS